MKKLAYIVLAFFAVSFFSCNKVEDLNNANTGDNGITTFAASMPESPLTKTTMSRPSILWAAGDKIRVCGYTEGQDVEQAIFTIKSGQGTKSAVFEIEEGQTMGTHTQYFAFYPSSIAIKAASLPTSFEVSSGLTVNAQAAVEGGFDPSLGIMTATADANGNLSFRHGVAYLGVQIPDDNITALKITFGKNAAQKRPVYSTTDGSITTNNSGTAELKAEGTFVKGSYYYLCAIPNTANKMTSVTITYTHNGVEKSRTSTSMADDKLEIGKLYDFGSPSIPVLPPVINASNVNIEATDEGGTITYSVDNAVTGGVLTAAIQDAGTISNLALGTPSSGSLTFTCDANTEATAKTATVRLTYTYNSPAETVTKDVVIKQAPSGGSLAPEEHTYIFCLNSSGGDAQTADGAPGAYFTVSGSSTLLCATSGSKPYFGVESYTIAGNVINYAKKIDSSNNVSFTTRTGFTSTVRFYSASRNTNTTATMKFNGTNYSLTWTDNKADLIDSGIINLSENTTYTFSKSGEVGLFYVIVEEVEK